MSEALLLPSRLPHSAELLLLFRCIPTCNTYTLISICGKPYNIQLTSLLTTGKREGVRGWEKPSKFSVVFFFPLKVSEGLIKIISESEGTLTTLVWGFFIFLCKTVRKKKKREGWKTDYNCLNCQDVKIRLPES